MRKFRSVSVGKRHGNTEILQQKGGPCVAILQTFFENFGTQTSKYLTFFQILSSELLRNHSLFGTKNANKTGTFNVVKKTAKLKFGNFKRN